MIKVLIVVSGLVLFVPDPPPDSHRLTALLRDTRHVQSPQGMISTKGAHGLTAHLPALRQQIDSSYRGWTITAPDDKDSAQVLFRVPVKAGLSIDPDTSGNFPHLDRLTAKPEDANIDPLCFEGKCKDGDKKRVATVVRFEGSWRTRPLQRCNRRMNLPLRFGQSASTHFDEIETARSEFRRPEDTALRPGQGRRPLATALGLEAEIEKLEDLYLEVKGSVQKLQLTNSDVCKEWLGVPDPCVVFEVENWEAPVASDCDVTDRDKLPPECRIDRHFGLLYDLILNPPKANERLLPFAAEGELKCPGREELDNQPGVRCPPTFTLPK
ncbi:MAG: hypothetical protein ACJ76N_14560 [Thermoanaerobaculia bacterium]